MSSVYLSVHGVGGGGEGFVSPGSVSGPVRRVYGYTPGPISGPPNLLQGVGYPSDRTRDM